MSTVFFYKISRESKKFFTNLTNCGILHVVKAKLHLVLGDKSMKCPYCGSESKVLDTRTLNEGATIKRRRECLECQKRFNTFEVLESVQIFVIKKNGEKELFDRTKLLAGVLKATQKRPVSADEIVTEIEYELQNSLKNEVSSVEVGEMVMEKLKARDHVAYVRFASVYREFTDVESFLNELLELKNKNTTKL